MLQVYTYQNPLKVEEGKNKFCFRSVVDQTINSERLVKEIVNYNSTITEADVRAVLSILNDRVKNFVNLGYKVELPFGFVFNRANGTVAHLNDSFISGTANHRITPVFKFKDDASEEMTKNAAYRVAGSGYVNLPEIKELFSVLSNGTESEKLEFTCGAMLKIKGKKLSFDADDVSQGVFLVANGKNDTRISAYNRVGSAVVEAYIPAQAAAGSYEIKLITKAGTERYAASIFSGKISVTA